jgi:hypothetical protein
MGFVDWSAVDLSTQPLRITTSFRWPVHFLVEASKSTAQSQGNYSTTWNETGRISDVSFSTWECRSVFPSVLAQISQQDESEAL